MKIDINLSEIASKKSNHKIMGYFNEFMEESCEQKSIGEYKKLLVAMGKWLDEARKGYGLM